MAAADRRKQLIEVAVEMFSRHGFEGTTTKSIAEKAGVSEAMLFRHFATKDDLYAALLDQKSNDAGVEKWIEELRAAAEKKDDAVVFRSLGEKILEAYQRDPQFQRLMLYASLESHSISKVYHKRRGLPIFEFLREYVAMRQKEGAFRDCDPGAVVFAMVGTPTYYAIVRRLFGLDVLKVSDSDLINTFVNLLLDGLRIGPVPRKTGKKKE